MIQPDMFSKCVRPVIADWEEVDDSLCFHRSAFRDACISRGLSIHTTSQGDTVVTYEVKDNLNLLSKLKLKMYKGDFSISLRAGTKRPMYLAKLFVSTKRAVNLDPIDIGRFQYYHDLTYSGVAIDGIAWEKALESIMISNRSVVGFPPELTSEIKTHVEKYACKVKQWEKLRKMTNKILVKNCMAKIDVRPFKVEYNAHVPN